MTENMTMKSLVIPAKEGKRGHAKIKLSSVKRANGYHINARCGECSICFTTTNEHEGMKKALNDMMSMIKNGTRGQVP